MQVGVKDDKPLSSADFASDAAHFIYCDEGDTVLVDILATFVNGTDCDSCVHGERTWQWVVTGATSYVIDSEYYLPDRGTVTFALSEAGNEITVTAIVGEAVPGDCDDGPRGQGEHNTASHGGAQASCTIKLWRMDMAVGETSEDPEGEPESIEPVSSGGSIYETVFAKSVTTTAQLVGAAPAATNPWSWESMIDPPQVHETKSSGSSWSGEMVASTSIFVTANVANGCDPATTATTTKHVFIQPNIRRPGWKMENVSASIGTDTNWLSCDENAFPGMRSQTPLGLNSNTATKYRDLPVQVVTPIYVDLSITNPGAYPPEAWPEGVPNDMGDFTDKVKEIENGPNIGFFYNNTPSIFEVNRIALLNYWTTPQGTWPSIVPNVNPNNGNPATNANWLALHTTGQQSCQCGDPGGHGASGVSNIRHIANYWHEGPGCPSSTNQEKLGHQILMKKAIEGVQPEKYDVLWRCDLLYADSEDALRVADEVERSDTSAELLTVSGSLHTFLSENPQKHNFYGFLWSYNSTSGWTQPMQKY